MLLKKANLNFFNRLIIGKNSISGINNAGRKTLYHRGAGVKRNLRIIDFNKYICNIPALMLSVEYDPNRTSLIALIAYSNGAVSYTLAVANTVVGSIITTVTRKTSVIARADSTFLNILKPGVYINSIEVNPCRGSTCTRAGGTFAKLVSLVHNKFAIVKLKSKTLINVNAGNIVTVGTLSTPFRYFYKNAGTRRRLGRRPHVRGVAMNPIDHPHGGGQGKTSGGRPSVTPWALTTKGRKTKRKITYAKTKVEG